MWAPESSCLPSNWDQDQVDSCGRTWLHYFVLRSSVRPLDPVWMKTALERVTARLCLSADNHGRTPLHYLAMWGCAGSAESCSVFMRKLLQRMDGKKRAHALLQLLDADGKDALFYATARGDVPMIAALSNLAAVDMSVLADVPGIVSLAPSHSLMSTFEWQLDHIARDDEYVFRDDDCPDLCDAESSCTSSPTIEPRRAVQNAASAAAPTIPELASSQSVDRGCLDQLRRDDVSAVSEVVASFLSQMPELGPFSLQLRKAAAALLLLHRWDKEKLLLAFLENPVQACHDAGISPCIVAQDASPHEEVLCAICFTPFVRSLGITACGSHWFDVECWKAHLSAKLDEGQNAVFARCPAVGCRTVAGDDVWEMVFLSRPFRHDPPALASALAKYRRFAVESYVTFHQSSIRWCSQPDCDRALILTNLAVVGSSGSVPRELHCACGAILCGLCFGAAHSPSGKRRR